MTLLWLSLLFLPLMTAVCLPFLLEEKIKKIATFSSIIGFILAVVLFFIYDESVEAQFSFVREWIPSLGIHFSLRLDGLSLLMIVLSKLMMPICLTMSSHIKTRFRAMIMCFLILDFAMTGTFLSHDIFLFYVFWELMLIPMILLIGVWGGEERIYAAVKFFIFTIAGSLLMLVAFLWLMIAHHEQFGYYSGEISSMVSLTFSPLAVFLGFTREDLIFLCLCAAFLIKVPLFPLHTWLPDAHVQAPTGGSVILASILLKTGAYGLFRFALPICPESFVKFSHLLSILALIGIFYGAFVAYSQSDLKKLVAYSSVSHMGFVVLGFCSLNVMGLTGSVLQMVNHGLSTGALFLLVGVLYERRHTRILSDFGGLARIVPWFSVVFSLVALSSMGLPGLNGFVGEFLVLLGTFEKNRAMGFISALGIIFGALYILLMMKKILFGPVTHVENEHMKDLSFREICCLLPLCFLIILLGLYPNIVIKKIEKTVSSYLIGIEKS